MEVWIFASIVEVGELDEGGGAPSAGDSVDCAPSTALEVED